MQGQDEGVFDITTKHLPASSDNHYEPPNPRLCFKTTSSHPTNSSTIDQQIFVFFFFSSTNCSQKCNHQSRLSSRQGRTKPYYYALLFHLLPSPILCASFNRVVWVFVIKIKIKKCKWTSGFNRLKKIMWPVKHKLVSQLISFFFLIYNYFFI